MGVCSEVSHRTVVCNPSAIVGPESDVERTIERLLVFTVALYERLVTRIITGEIHDLEHKRLPNFGKVDELDLVTDFWGRGSRIRRREAEITLSAAPRCTGPTAKEFGTKSMPVNEESAASVASGDVIGCGG